VAALAVTFAPVLAVPGWAATGAVYVAITKAGFIVGIDGLSSFGATIGASKADLIGRAYNMR